MVVDAVMGLAALLIGALLLRFSAPLADHLQETDDRVRERSPWVETFEPQAGTLGTAQGRWLILRTWLVLMAFGFTLVGALLLLRTTP